MTPQADKLAWLVSNEFVGPRSRVHDMKRDGFMLTCILNRPIILVADFLGRQIFYLLIRLENR
jgi:hypothetical protein